MRYRLNIGILGIQVLSGQFYFLPVGGTTIQIQPKSYDASKDRSAFWEYVQLTYRNNLQGLATFVNWSAVSF